MCTKIQLSRLKFLPEPDLARLAKKRPNTGYAGTEIRCINTVNTTVNVVEMVLRFYSCLQMASVD